MSADPAGSAPDGGWMSLFFDADWFDARLAERWLDRAALAACAGIDTSQLEQLFTNQRAPTAHELEAFAKLLSKDLVEVTLRAGVATRAEQQGETSSARIEDIEARLDAVDAWLQEFEAAARKRA
ncbi:MAG: helix-turn-helix transcriptional regulator [Proteobacteria bacterium]|nr:helix-turn-helix transcriptional regulator [Pseudomonadota bacterium]